MVHDRFRSLKLEKERIQTDIARPKGAMACLTAVKSLAVAVAESFSPTLTLSEPKHQVGFLEKDNVLVLPLDADVEEVANNLAASYMTGSEDCFLLWS